MTPKNRVLLYIGGILIIMVSSSFIFPRYGGKSISGTQQSTTTIPLEQEETIKINPDLIDEEEENYTLSITLPVVSGMEDIEKQEKVNMFLKEKIDNISLNFKNSIPKISDGVNQSALEISYEELFLSQNIISIKLDISKYIAGDGSPTTDLKILNFDTDKSKEIFLEDIFNQDSQYLFYLSTVTAQKLLDSYTGVGKEEVEYIKNITSSKRENFQIFSLNAKGITIYFQTDTIGSLASGAEEVSIVADDGLLEYVQDGSVKNLWSKI